MEARRASRSPRASGRSGTSSGQPRGPRSVAPRRLAAIFTVFAIAFTGLGGRLIVLQIFDAPAYARLAVDQRKREIEIPARRGSIFDRNGEPLAISVDVYSVFADPAHVQRAYASARALAPILKMSSATVLEALRGSGPDDRFEYIARQIAPAAARRIKEMELPGVYLQPEAKRFYPGKALAAHLLGFTNIDGDGLSGSELQYDKQLRGRPGRTILEQDPTGRAMPQASFAQVEAAAGRSLILTIDKDIQYQTEIALAEAARQFHAESGSAIVMRPRTGEILAMANVPTFDPNHPGEFSTDEQRNRALTDVYEPGSAFKVVALSAALEEGTVTPETMFVVPDSMQVSDRIFHDSHPHATERMSVAEIIHESSNVGTIQIGLGLGADRLDSYVRRFGLGRSTGLQFPGESSGIVLDRDEWTGPTIATVPIGQGIAVTPLQMACIYATLANGGVRVEPTLLYSTVGAEGDMSQAPVPDRKRVVSRSTARSVVEILRGVVDEGTGIEAQIPGYDVAGKTGTAQKPLPGGGYGQSYVASFAGFAPARNPQIVAIVVLDEPSPIWGGATAAPTFKRIVEFALRHLGVAPTRNPVKAVQELETESEPVVTYD
ncbi:MAG TPA: penicillin-binding protein 2 [Actinomycetota bacterium]|nr:penicillin-binding protein 2 [Actinomycetota bacterium]